MLICRMLVEIFPLSRAFGNPVSHASDVGVDCHVNTDSLKMIVVVLKTT